MRKLGLVPAVAGLVAALALSGVLTAQDRGAPGGRRQGMRQGGAAGETRGQRGDRPRFDLAQMVERRVEDLREPLGATDDEWKVIQPLAKDVVEKQFATFMGGFRGGRRGGPGVGGPGPGGETQPEIEALEKALEDKATPAQDIKAKLQALREVRQKREADLKQARTKLREVLTVRQEATLVLRGILD